MSLSQPRRRPAKPLLVQLIEAEGWSPITAPFSDEICPRCNDAALRADPALDGRDSGGERVCAGCTWTTDLRASPNT